MRRATLDDVPFIVSLIEELREAVNGPIPVCRPHASATVARLIGSPTGYVAVTGGGFIAGCLAPTLINPALIAQEMGWFSRDRSGIALLRGFEVWAAVMGAALVQLSTGANGPDLSRLGYRHVEKAWIK